MRFLVDAQLPPALARLFTALGHPAEHVSDCGLLQASDESIRSYAANVAAVIVSKDEDFVNHRVLKDGPPIVWVRLGNVRKATLLKRIEAECPRLVAALQDGEAVIELT